MATPLVALAELLDPSRARRLRQELGSGPASDVALVLAAAFPPLLPRHEWQVRALGALARDGWRAPRRRQDLLPRLFAAVGELDDSEAVARELRRFAWAERARIALRELLPPSLGGADVDVTARELTDLAEVSFELALAEAGHAVATRHGVPRLCDGTRSSLVVIGLGKLGGLELNAGSDVDVMFVYDGDEAAGAELDQHWTRVARRAVSMLETPSEDGQVWRVDLRLRPEGARGAMACSLASAERYYETWGRLWERAALLRARPIAGHRELGWRLEREVLSPFTWRREVDPSLATALAELVLRARAELSEDPARDLKLGPGGIREAEFFVQSLQLVWGGVEPTLRVPGTIAALARLRSRGLVSDLEARTIADAWRLLRRVEHRVQWMTGAQTHLLPDDPDELERLARGLGHRDWSELRVEIERARARVSELFASLAPERPRPPPRWEALLARLAEGVAPQEAAPALGPETLEHLAALGRRPDGLLGALTRERRPELADRVLDAVADSPDPEQAAAALRTFFARLSSPAPYVAALADEPRALSRFVTALGGSAFVAEAIVSSPDLADVTLFGPSQLGPDTARALIDAEIAVATLALERRAEASEASDRHQALVGALRRAKRRMMVEVAVADLADQIDTREATRLLSGLADEILERAVRLELGDARGLGVIAVGKLGGRDIGYGSDLDVLFLFDRAAAPPGAHAPEYFTRAAQRVIRAISALHPDGPGYELDTRLRPSGSHGLLVTSIGAFARYHGVTRDGASERPPPSGPSVLASGAAWERQSLLRARACAGDPALGAEAIRIAHVAAYERGAPPAGEVHHMRRRIEIEIARERAGRWDLKLGRGGLLDVEFAVQWLQMRHGMDRRVRTTDIAQALEALATLGYVARNHYEALREGYAFLRRLEQRVHVVHGSGATRLDEAAPGLEPLARRMGVSSSARRGAVAILLDRYRDVTASIRAAYLGILGVADEG